MLQVARMPNLTKDNIDTLLRGFFEGLLSSAEEQALMIPDDPDIDLAFEIEELRSYQTNLKDQIGTRKYDYVTQNNAHTLLETNGYEAPGLSSEEFDAICIGILRARAEQCRILRAMLQGKYEDTEPVDPLFKGIASPG